jgi:ABC-2 type transport system ATP-binding protein
VAIRVRDVHKDFRLPHHHDDSIKHKIITMFRKKDKGADLNHALRGVSFDVKKGEFFGVVGRNGSGKSTLLKIISKIYQPTSGTADYEGKLVAFIELGVGFNPQLTGRENVYLNAAMLGFSRRETAAMYDEIVAFAELEKFMELDLKNYSSGMKVRLAFSVAIRANADILVLDEVLAVGDKAFQQKCYDYFQNLKDEHKTIIFVSHSMGLVKKYCDRAILIENGKIAHEGSAEEVADAYDAMFADVRGAGAEQGKRWGSGEVRFTNLQANVINEKVTISADIKSYADISNVIADLQIRDERNLVAAIPRHLKNEHKFDIKSGKTKHIEFAFDNLFGGNSYRVNAGLKSADGKQIYDLWQKAAEFTNEDRPRLPTIYPLEIKSGKST